MSILHGIIKIFFSHVLIQILIIISDKSLFTPGAHPRRGTAGSLKPPQTPQNLKKNTDFEDISKVLRDLPFSRNQPLKSADH
jgi:hypothetical protein